MYSLGIDAGSTSLKVILFDDKGNIQSKVRVEYYLEYPKPNFVEIDAEHYWKALKNGTNQILATCKIDPVEICSLAISSQGETFIP